jgi:hypothetical protein
MEKVPLQSTENFGRIVLQRGPQIGVDCFPRCEDLLKCERGVYGRELPLQAHGFGIEPEEAPGNRPSAEAPEVQLLRKQEVAEVFDDGPLAALGS